jgi:hypothetical protein
MPATEPTDDDRAAASEGAMSVVQAAKECGECRTRLFTLMGAGVLQWYATEGGHRRILRKSLREYVARQIAEHRANPKPAKKLTPKRAT